MEANSKPLYQPWNEEEFQADVFVRGMTWIQRHLYRALLQAMFFHGTRPYLPKDDDVLWVLAGAETPEMWEANKARVLKRFRTCDHDDELLENKRVTADWNNLQSYRDVASEQGQTGGKKSAEVRRAKYGTAQPFKPMLVDVCSTEHPNPPSEPFDENSPNTEASKEKVSKEKISEVNKTSASDSSFSQESKPMGGDWKAIAIRHKRYFSKKAGVNFKKDYEIACLKYTEAVVLECFDAWAPGALSWVRDKNVDQPLYSFFKKLPEEAADTIEVAAAVKDEDAREASTKRKADAAQAASIERQTKEITDLMQGGQKTAGESAEDFMKDEG